MSSPQISQADRSQGNKKLSSENTFMTLFFFETSLEKYWDRRHYCSLLFINFTDRCCKMFQKLTNYLNNTANCRLLKAAELNVELNTYFSSNYFCCQYAYNKSPMRCNYDKWNVIPLQFCTILCIILSGIIIS